MSDLLTIIRSRSGIIYDPDQKFNICVKYLIYYFCLGGCIQVELDVESPGTGWDRFLYPPVLCKYFGTFVGVYIYISIYILNIKKYININILIRRKLHKKKRGKRP